MWTAAAPDGCMILSGLRQRVIGKALHYVTWAAARLWELMDETSNTCSDNMNG